MGYDEILERFREKKTLTLNFIMNPTLTLTLNPYIALLFRFAEITRRTQEEKRHLLAKINAEIQDLRRLQYQMQEQVQKSMRSAGHRPSVIHGLVAGAKNGDMPRASILQTEVFLTLFSLFGIIGECEFLGK